MGTPASRRRGSRRPEQAIGVGAVLLLLAACSSSSSSGAPTRPPASTCSAPGGAVTGPADDHCTVNNTSVARPTDRASCAVAVAGDDASGDAGSGDDGSVVVVEDGGGPTGNCEPASYGPTQYGQAGSDDDCKYDVTWSPTEVCEGGNGVYFTLSVHRRTDHSAVTGANPYIEAVKGCVTPAQNVPPPATELGNGQYKIGPIVFQEPGRWVVRFHIFGLNCSDALPTSPHGHVAFFVDVQ